MLSELFHSKLFWFRFVVTLFILLLFGAFSYWMHHNYYVIDPYNSALAGTQRYGHNGEGDFESYVKVLAIEIFILLGILRPYSLRPEHWLRSLIALCLFGGWSFLLLLGAMHSGGVNMIHLLCLIGISAFLFVLTLVSVVVAAANHKIKPNNNEGASTT
jgi:amino acid transporter